MPLRPTVIVADDDTPFRLVVRQCLEANGFHVLDTSDGEEAFLIAQKSRPALILLDIQMAGWDGWRTLTEMRRHGLKVPIMMVTGRGDETSRISGLDSGADDYITKPCSVRELLARIRALLRRCPPADRVDRLRLGDIVIDLGKKSASRGERGIAFTRKEYDLLELLARGRGRPIPRAIILGRVWGIADETNSHTLDTHLWRLRSKLGRQPDGSDWIRNIPGSGYVLDGRIEADDEGKKPWAA